MTFQKPSNEAVQLSICKDKNLFNYLISGAHLRGTELETGSGKDLILIVEQPYNCDSEK